MSGTMSRTLWIIFMNTSCCKIPISRPKFNHETGRLDYSRSNDPEFLLILIHRSTIVSPGQLIGKVSTVIQLSSLEELLANEARSVHDASRSLEKGECQSPAGKRCALCLASTFLYDKELPLKTGALLRFWQDHALPVPLSPLVASPAGRGYRTVTKRRVFSSRKGWVLGLIDTSIGGYHHAFPVVRCAIEPREHAAIYATANESLSKPYAASLAERLRYIIIKGSYAEFTVILNVIDSSPQVVKGANTLSKALTRAHKQIAGVHLYEDTSDGRYYLGGDDPGEKRMKKLFGRGSLFQRIGGRPFLYGPGSFSQVNQSIVESLVDTAARLLVLQNGQTLYDLYCGYGLFSLSLAPRVKRVVGAEISRTSINAAIANAERQKVSNARFLRSDITAEAINTIMKGASPEDVVLLDPPRNGTAPGVIEEIAARKPARLLHIFCNSALIQREMKRWKTGGYRGARAIPFDMFPGTAAVEILVLLERAPS